MSTTMRRRPLTAAMLTLLEHTGKPVGDGESPKDGGWSSDANKPGATFTPYTALVSLPASRSMGQFVDDQDTWLMPYKLICVGDSRQQCDWMGDKALDVLDLLQHTRVDVNGAWKVMQVQVVTLDGPAKIDLTEPPYWQRGDTVTVWLTKE